MAWEKVAERTYPEWNTYAGVYDKVVATFQTGPEQLTWVLTNPIGEWIADGIEREALAKGASPLFFSLHKDTSPTWTTQWQVDLWLHGSPMAPAIIAIIIVGALAALGIAYFSFKLVSQIQATKRAEIQKETEATRIAFVDKYEPIIGTQATQDLLAGITTPTAQQVADNPSLWDDLRKAIPSPVGIGALLLIGLLAFMAVKK